MTDNIPLNPYPEPNPLKRRFPTWRQFYLNPEGNEPIDTGNGGTGIQTYNVGDIVYADGTTSLTTLAKAIPGNVLLSGDAPEWGKVGLSTHTSGTIDLDTQTSGLLDLSTKTTGAIDLTTQSIGTIDLATQTTGSLPPGSGGSLPTLTDGQVVIGRTGTDPVAASITAGHGITVTNGTGSITVALTPSIAQHAGTVLPTVTTTSATPIALADTSITLLGGLYIIWFNGNFQFQGDDNEQVVVELRLNGVGITSGASYQQSTKKEFISCISLCDIVYLSPGTLQVYWAVTNGKVCTFSRRHLMLIRLGT